MNIPTILRRILPLLLLIISMQPLWAQPDRDTSLLLRPEVLKEQDVRAFQQTKSPYDFQSANRVTEELTELPYSTWVITSDEILRYGMVTLADVLRAAPGIRVSQPGNALEGETFMMRGVSGNQYVKILINDVPVKPTHALGMPIGAQLPIRQAERVEVLYGSGGSLMYGNEACAGVVNIILKETERPIFTQADLSTGPKGFNNLDLMFGGRLFKDKNVLQFSVFGSSTVRNYDFNKWDKSVFSVNTYLPTTITTEDFAITDFESIVQDSTGQYRHVTLNHESRMFGINLRWKFLRFAMYQMQRSDPTSLGYSPMASSYASTGNNLRERINVYNLRGGLKSRVGHLFSQLTLTQYNIANNSSEVITFNRLNRLGYLGSGANNLPGSDYRRDNIWGNIINYTGGTRYMAAKSLMLQGELSTRFRIWGNFWGAIGGYSQVALGYTQVRYGFVPINLEVTGYDSPALFSFSQSHDFLQIHNYANVEYRSKKLKASLGTNILVSLYRQELNNFVRGSLQYEWKYGIHFFTNYAESYKVNHPYQDDNTQYFDKNYQVFRSNWGGGSFDGPLNELETIRSFDIGVKRKFSEVSFFYQNAYNLGRDGYLYGTPDSTPSVGGYYFKPGLSQSLWGLQARLVGISTSEFNKRKKRDDYSVDWKGEIVAQYTRGTEYYGQGYQNTELRNVPRMNFSMRTSGRSGRTQTTVAVNYQSKVLSKDTPFAQRWGVPNSGAPRFYNSFWSTDIMVRFYLNRNFVLYANVFNLFNRTTYGLDASGNPDDLRVPLQLGRQVRLGITYNMN